MRCGFQHLELQVRSDGFGVPRQQFRQAQREVGLLEVARRDVDADRDVQPVASPQRQMLECARQHPVAHARRQPGVFDQRQKLHRRHQPLLRVFPAQQRLEAVYAAGAHVHLGLVVQHELLHVQRFLDAADSHHALFGAAAVFSVEEQVAVAPSLLRPVHGMVGVAHQGVGVAVVDGVDGGAHAGGDLHRVLCGVDEVGQRHHSQHALDGHARFFQRASAQQQHKFVAAQPRGRVFPVFALAQCAAQAAGQLGQQAVAGGVPEAVVHRLETVQVQVAHHQQVAVAVGGVHGFVQQVRQQRTVGQPRQLVEVGLALQLFALHLLFGDVGDHQHVVTQVTGWAQHGGDGGLQGAQLASASPFVQFAPPMPGLRHPGPHGGTLPARDRVGRRGAQQRGHGAQHVFAVDAQNLRIRLVQVQHTQLGVGDQQTFVQVLEQAGRHALALYRVAPGLDVGQRGQQPGRLPLAVAFHDQQGGFQPAPRGAGGGHAQFDVLAAGVAARQAVDALFDMQTVFGMHLLQPGGRRPGLFGVARQRAPGAGRKAALVHQ